MIDHPTDEEVREWRESLCTPNQDSRRGSAWPERVARALLAARERIVELEDALEEIERAMEAHSLEWNEALEAAHKREKALAEALRQACWYVEHCLEGDDVEDYHYERLDKMHAALHAHKEAHDE